MQVAYIGSSRWCPLLGVVGFRCLFTAFHPLVSRWFYRSSFLALLSLAGASLPPLPVPFPSERTCCARGYPGGGDGGGQGIGLSSVCCLVWLYLAVLLCPRLQVSGFVLQSVFAAFYALFLSSYMYFWLDCCLYM